MDLIVATVRAFNSYSSESLRASLERAKSRNQKIFPIIVNSYGGEVYSLLEMIDALDASGMKIITMLNGVAMSAGSVLFARGDERYMSPNSTIMLHEASFFTWGKNSDVKSTADHVNDLNNRLFQILNSRAGKEDGFFENLIKENNNADLYLNAEKAIEYGLATSIKIPSPEELRQIATNENRSAYANYRILMELADSQPENNYFNETQEDNQLSKAIAVVTLAQVMASLTAEQQAPINLLVGDLENAKNEITNLKNSISDKETEINNLKQSYDEKINKIVDDADKSFLESLLNQKKISKADYDKEIKMLKELSAVPTAKEAYKAKISNSSPVVEGEIPDTGERDYSPENTGSASIEEVRAFCKNQNIALDEQSISSIRNAYNAFYKSKAGK